MMKHSTEIFDHYVSYTKRYVITATYLDGKLFRVEVLNQNDPSDKTVYVGSELMMIFDVIKKIETLL